jgi:hypothetical protein
VLRPQSRGFVRLKSTDPRDPLAIVQNFLSTQGDWEGSARRPGMAEEFGAAPTSVGCGASLLVVADNQQYGKENADNDRHNLMPAAGGLAVGRFGSGLLRRSDSRPEAKVAHRMHLICFSLSLASSLRHDLYQRLRSDGRTG